MTTASSVASLDSCRSVAPGVALPLLKFSGGSVTFYATFSTDPAMPSC
jgi:hypothetical protein